MKIHTTAPAATTQVPVTHITRLGVSPSRSLGCDVISFACAILKGQKRAQMTQIKADKTSSSNNGDCRTGLGNSSTQTFPAGQPAPEYPRLSVSSVPAFSPPPAQRRT